jgi:hypothetical protein
MCHAKGQGGLVQDVQDTCHPLSQTTHSGIYMILMPRHDVLEQRHHLQVVSE